MDFDQLNLAANISEDLLARVRQNDRVFPGRPTTHAAYNTTFYGQFRVEIDYGRACRVAIEHVAGDLAFDWCMAEADHRRPPSGRRRAGEPPEPPTRADVEYRIEVFDADPTQGLALLDTAQGLDWGEPTPDSRNGRDGVILYGTLSTDLGVRSWTTWSPDPDVEPAKCVFFQRVLEFAVEHGSGSLRDDLARVTL